jgi:hypothetical protein
MSSTTRGLFAEGLVIVASILAACGAPDARPTREATSADGSGATAPGPEAAPLPEALWVDATAELLDSTAEWTNKVELADLNGDGLLDLLFANGGNYSSPGDPVANRAFVNPGDGGRFVDRSAEVFGPTPDLSRVIKARDFDGDGAVDVFVGATYQTRSRLYLGDGSGGFTERTATHLPGVDLSLGDAEPGDVDADGDLDLVLADWGPGDNMVNDGGRTRLWLNDGTGRFTDATNERMPEARVRFSWDLEFVDVDNDFDLDVLVSCKRCAGGFLFRNDGAGRFEEDRRGLPQYTNNYEYEAMDLDGDGFLDLVTINDGDIVGESGGSRREHVFRNDGEGRFRDATDAWWPDSENIGEDDNMVAFLDYDSDGDADFVIGSLSGPDRLLVNDGAGGLRTANGVFAGADTPGTLGIALGDLDGDGRLDVVQAQGEVRDAEEERIYLGSGFDVDTSPPVVGPVRQVPEATGRRIEARVHDRKSPSLPTEWQSVEVRWRARGEARATPLAWYGEYLWRARVAPDAEDLQVCARDAAGNEACARVPDADPAEGADGP